MVLTRLISISRMFILVLNTTLALTVLFPEFARSACLVDEDLSQFCGKSSWVVPITWTPNSPARYRLLKTNSVQNTLKGCDMYIKIIKAECQPPRPVYGVYYDPKGMGVQIFQLKVEKGLPALTKSMPDFVTYFQYATPTPPTNPFIPNKRKYTPENGDIRSRAR